MKEIVDETLDTIEANTILETPPMVEEFDILMIGDLLTRNDEEFPNQKMLFDCIPDGRPADVIKRYKKLRESKVFQKVILHVGTNLIPTYSPATVSDRIINCMGQLRELSPKNTEVLYSNILPKIHDRYLPGINRINKTVNTVGITGHKSKKFRFIPPRKAFI